MDALLITEKINTLPEVLQSEVLDFVNFLLQHYQIEQIESNEELSPFEKQLFDERYAEYKANPQNVKNIEEVKDRLLKKYGGKL